MLIIIMCRFDTQDSLYDTAWSEIHENQIIVACGDGSVKLFDISLENYPIQSWQEHNREVYSVAWNLVSKDTFASSSWDGTIKVVCLPSEISTTANKSPAHSGLRTALNRSSRSLPTRVPTAVPSRHTRRQSSLLFHLTRTYEYLICAHQRPHQTTSFI